jgi:hypothetical protein
MREMRDIGTSHGDWRLAYPGAESFFDTTQRNAPLVCRDGHSSSAGLHHSCVVVDIHPLQVCMCARALHVHVRANTRKLRAGFEREEIDCPSRQDCENLRNIMPPAESIAWEFAWQKRHPSLPKSVIQVKDRHSIGNPHFRQEVPYRIEPGISHQRNLQCLTRGEGHPLLMFVFARPKIVWYRGGWRAPCQTCCGRSGCGHRAFCSAPRWWMSSKC